jgi:adenylylsulfate reductase subunit A
VVGDYVDRHPVPTCLRNHALLEEVKAGRGPIRMVTKEAFQDPHNETIGWENFLGMTIGQAVVWASQNIDPKHTNPELTTSEPYVMGSHATCSGAWASGPSDYAPAEYQWGYNRMMTVDGLFGAGDTIGGTAHKFSSGSFTEGRIAAKAAVNYVNDMGSETPQVSEAEYTDLKKTFFKPLETYAVGRNEIVAGTVSPSYLLPIHGLQRLEKIMDEYVGGIGAHYTTNEPLLTRGLELLAMLKEDLELSRSGGPSPASTRVGTAAPVPGVGVRNATHDVQNGDAVARDTIIAPIIPSWTTPIGIASRCPATTGIPGNGKWRKAPVYHIVD